MFSLFFEVSLEKVFIDFGPRWFKDDVYLSTSPLLEDIWGGAAG